MLHDNARPHIAAVRKDLIATFGWEQFEHPPYNSELAPSAFHVFLHLKTFLAGGIILRTRDTKTGAPLQQVHQQWWKLCRKLV
jgi:hypothetical protein